MLELHSGNEILKLDYPKVMGVINCTPDSFYASSRAQSLFEAQKLIDQMLNEGVDILDIGGSSSKPGNIGISPEEEINRVKEVVEFVVKHYPKLWMSIDTTHAEVAKYAVENGCRIVNDISSGEMDDQMLQTVSNLKVPYVCMHMQGKPENMQVNPIYKNVVNEVYTFLENKIKQAEMLGIRNCIIDPGFGFGKTIEQNYTLLKGLDHFQELKRPLLVGFSRKSMIYKVLNTDPNDSLNGTTALNMIGLLKGASILRVHDVKAAKQTKIGRAHV